MEKCKSCGLRGNIYNLLQSYLSDRQQRVLIDGYESDTRAVTYGVPQGTVLGPRLFTIYVNNLLSLQTVGNVISFADDTAILYSADSWYELKEIILEDFGKFINWFKENKLTLNKEKTVYLPFTSYYNNLPNLGNLNIDGEITIPEAESVRYLGIILDRHFRWNIHIESITRKIRPFLSRLKYLKSFLSIGQLKKVYFALVESQLTYGIISWGGINDCHLSSLETLQKWILRIIYNRNINYSSERLFIDSSLLDIRQLFCQKLLISVKKQKINVISVLTPYNIREKNKNKVMKCKKSIGQRSAQYLGPKLHNLLPNNLKMNNNMKNFKTELREWIVNKKRKFFHDFVNNSIH